MNILTIIIALGLLIFFSHAFNELFSRTRIPNVLLLLLIGIIVGPIGGLVTNDFFGEIGKVFTQITLIVILFESGANLKLKDIKESVGHASILTILNFIVTLGITIVIARYLIGLDMLSSFFVGAIIGGTSSAVVIPMVKQLKFGQKSSSILILESALSDVLCLVVGLAILEGMVEGEVSVGVVFSEIWKDFLFAMLLGLLGGFIWSLVINLVRSIRNSMMTTLAFVFILYGIVELLKFNGGIAVLSFGILLSNVELINTSNVFQRLFKFETSGFNDNERDFFAEIVFVMQTYFFVYVGISIQFGSPWTYAAGFLIVILIILFRAPAMRLFIGKRVSKPERAVMSVMSPKGMVPAVLASIPLQMGLNKADKILDLGYSVVLFSIVVTSILVIILSFNPSFFEDKIQKLKKKENPSYPDSSSVDDESPE
jgi:NhaP-type Na+/H+ or K+/H+ antiporter